MSGRDSDDERETPENKNLTRDYEVGYSRPPVASRFLPGQSGNPSGRPRRARSANLDPACQPADRLFREEAYRQVAVREGNKTVKLPAIQAAMRAQWIAAMKGDRHAQNSAIDRARKMEEAASRERAEAIEVAIEYRRMWTEELQRRRQLGIESAPPVPDPEDIRINPETGRVEIAGPRDEEHKKEWDRLLDRRDAAQLEVANAAAEYRKCGEGKGLRNIMLMEWHYEQQIFDIINDAMPARYKATLKHRSFYPGASEAGKTLEKFRNDRNRRIRARTRRVTYRKKTESEGSE